MDIRVLDSNPLYQGQIYRLSFLFGENYPIGTLPISGIRNDCAMEDEECEMRDERKKG
jgi:ubiquitin-conjugating enzyme E2 W